MMSMHEQDKHTKNIFIVEDNEHTEPRFFTALHEETPYRLLHVTSAQQALELSEHIKPHLLLLMNYPPDMSGVELYDRIRARKGLEDTPALFLNAQLPRQTVAQRNIVCLSKPCKIELFIQSLEALIALPRTTISV